MARSNFWRNRLFPANRRCRCREGSSMRARCNSGGFRARFLVDHRALCARVRKGIRAFLRAAGCKPGQFRFFGESGSAVLPDLPEAGRPPAEAGRRSDHGRQPAFRPRSIPSFRIGLVPVFVDVDIPTYNIEVAQIGSGAFTANPGRYGGAHPGQSVRSGRGEAFAKQHNLWLVEDCCDAVGSTFGAAWRERSGIWRRPVSIPRITSRWARAAPC